ncbi:MAG: translation elongation factor Ts [Candidatus Omnitrophica bacterium]|nr:translation elongation factor Ts [Candidatus Omnitrophota bacterium]
MVKENVDQVRELRSITGAGIMDCKRALAEAKGDFQRAQDLLRKRGFEIAQKKSGRVAKEGQIFSYIHLGAKIGVLVEINCETDFVARNSEFQQFGRDIAMQIAASRPLFVSREEIDSKWLEHEKEMFRAQAKAKPVQIQDEIVQGKLEKRFEEVCLLNQRFIKNEEITVKDLLTTLISKLGEHVVIKRFTRFEISSD